MGGVHIARHGREQLDVVVGERALELGAVTHTDLVEGVVLDPLGVQGHVSHVRFPSGRL